MTRGWIPALVCVLFAVPAAAALLVDPFLEDVRVGAYGTLDEVETIDGWPADLFASPHWSAAWVAAWDRAATDAPPLRLPPPETARAWLDARRAAWTVRDSLAAAGTTDLPDFLRESLLAKRVLDLAPRDPETALRTLDVLLRTMPPYRLDETERFVWSLRRRALETRITPRAPNDVLWPELLDLGPYDRNTGWALWATRRRHLGRPLLPAEPAEDAVARFVASLGNPGLTPRDIDRAPYSSDARSALGAAVLPTSSLRRHFGQFPDPPADAQDQDHWLRGRWRLLGWTAAAAERLAALPGIADEHRAGYLRRAADKQASDGYWGSVIPNLRAARLLAERSGRRGVLSRVNLEIERMAALSVHQGRIRAANLLRDLAAAVAPAPQPGRLGDYERHIADGAAASVTGTFAPYAPDRARAAAARAWIHLGRTLAADRAAEDPRWPDYGVALAGIGEGDVFAGLARVISAALAQIPWREDLYAWELLRHLADDGEAPPPAESTPIPQLVSDTESVLERHLLLGAALLLDDARGQLAAVVALPRPGLDADENLRLLYPTPGDADLRRRLDGAGLDPALVLAVARNESRFDPAVRSRSGALGWMQIMPFHYPDRGHHDGEVVWRRLGASVDAGLALLREAVRRYNGDPYRSLADYNAGPGAVRRWDAQLGPDAPASTFLAWVGYPETRRYVEKVLIDRAVYDWILGDVPNESAASPESN